MLAAIQVVAGGDSLLAPSATRRLIEEFTRRADPDPDPASVPKLSARDRAQLVITAYESGVVSPADGGLGKPWRACRHTPARPAWWW